eukprot:TRINITY_DN7590_c0_g1_i3.p1 TRINITY_DN7590_c0_g1~~TRINITY_DN7590_c0_g1_i3.p1  ORF type:complete len:193 (-),score=50.41 TRINITY_DN7590_c0_g1_i3:173-751(-)
MILHDRRTNQDVLVLNTHWDHKGTEARNQSGILTRKYISEMTKASPFMPIILAGDFNLFPNAEGLKHLEMTGIHQELIRSPSQDFGVEMIGSEPITFTGWNREHKMVLDYIFYKNVRCLQYGALDDACASGRLLSDHKPLFTRLLLEKKQPTEGQEIPNSSESTMSNVSMDPNDEDLELELALQMSMMKPNE